MAIARSRLHRFGGYGGCTGQRLPRLPLVYDDRQAMGVLLLTMLLDWALLLISGGISFVLYLRRSNRAETENEPEDGKIAELDRVITSRGG